MVQDGGGAAAAATIPELMDVLAGLLDESRRDKLADSPDNKKAIQCPHWLALTPGPSLGRDPGRSGPGRPQALAGGRLQGRLDALSFQGRLSTGV